MFDYTCSTPLQPTPALAGSAAQATAVECMHAMNMLAQLIALVAMSAGLTWAASSTA